MGIASIGPLSEVPVDPLVAALPKADLHVHQEWAPRLDRVLARREGRPPFDWRAHARLHLAETPPGMDRLGRIFELDASLSLSGAPQGDPETAIAVWEDVLEEGAADGAILVEVRFGVTGLALARPDFMGLFREAERRVQSRHPRLRAEAIGYLGLRPDPARLADAGRRLEICLRAARDGLAGVDFRVDPYDTEAAPALWETAYRWAERAADAGLGITVHAGEYSTANLQAALRVPGLRRLGHAVYAAAEPRLLEAVAGSGVTVECCPSCNVVSGAVPSYEAHPLRQFVEHGIPVTLNTDDPVRVWTTIGREYAIAAAIGFGPAELLGFTRNAVRASFASARRREALLGELQE
jgi:adenosine deaminase